MEDLLKHFFLGLYIKTLIIYISNNLPLVLLLLILRSENPVRGEAGRRVSQEYFRNSIRKESNFLRLRQGQRSQGPEAY